MDNDTPIPTMAIHTAPAAARKLAPRSKPILAPLPWSGSRDLLHREYRILRGYGLPPTAARCQIARVVIAVTSAP